MKIIGKENTVSSTACNTNHTCCALRSIKEAIVFVTVVWDNEYEDIVRRDICIEPYEYYVSPQQLSHCTM